MSMRHSFAHHEHKINPLVRTLRNDFRHIPSHNRNMARRGKPTSINWYLKEWMDTVFPKPRGRQAKMCELTGWTKATCSQLYNNIQDYSPKIVNEAAKALNAEPWELLMPPERAMALRRIRASAEEIVTLAHDAEEKAKHAEPNRATSDAA
jgi:hypothetical protein